MANRKLLFSGCSHEFFSSKKFSQFIFLCGELIVWRDWLLRFQIFVLHNCLFLTPLFLVLMYWFVCHLPFSFSKVSLWHWRKPPHSERHDSVVEHADFRYLTTKSLSLLLLLSLQYYTKESSSYSGKVVLSKRISKFT